ncbi:MAG: enoyl-CoA hydratase-related protein [Gemmatimonadota bacterium]
MASESFQTVAVSVDHSVGTLTLNRPDKLNAFTAAMVDEGLAALRHLVERDDVRAILITGAGHGFCAGADLDELKLVLAQDDTALARRLVDVARSWARHIAAAPPLAVHLLKHAVYLSERATLDEMLDYELEAQLACFRSEDAREGLDAFFAKRTPHFHGR